MKKNGMKKVWVPVIALCSAGLLVGTGFAAWTITQTQNGTTSGNRKADKVEDKHIKVTNIKWYKGQPAANSTSVSGLTPVTDGNPTVVFGWADTTSETLPGSWLTNTDDAFKEDRKFTLTFDVEKGTSVTDYDIAVNMVVTDKTEGETTGAFANCVSKGLVEAPGTPQADGNSLNYKLVAKKVENADSYVVDVSFKWGSHFENKNPIKFYNQYTDETWAKDQNPGTKTGTYDSSIYKDFTDSLNAINNLNSTGEKDKETPRFNIEIVPTYKKVSE